MIQSIDVIVIRGRNLKVLFRVQREEPREVSVLLNERLEEQFLLRDDLNQMFIEALNALIDDRIERVLLSQQSNLFVLILNSIEIIVRLFEENGELLQGLTAIVNDQFFLARLNRSVGWARLKHHEIE